MNDRACGGATPRCDRAMGRCVACVTNAHCPTTEVCAAGRCTTSTACMTSRTCPGQVCDPTRGQCVDGVGATDCAAGLRCVDGACLPPPRACTSSRDCSSLDQVCETVRMQCVDGVGNNDCQTTEYCAAGVCRARVCGGGRADCDENPGNGCEADLQRSASHCGACGSACASTASTVGTCVAGTCRGSCNAGHGDCDGAATNGCGVELRSSVAHCGMCGRACATGTLCVAGNCIATPTMPAQMSDRRMGFGMARYPDGRVLVVGGFGRIDGSGNTASLTTTSVNDPVGNRWSAGPTLPEPLNAPAVVLGPDGQVDSFGGLGIGTSFPTTVVYVLPALNGAWRRVGTLPVARYAATAVTVGPRIWVIGGLLSPGEATPRVEVYDPTTQGFTAGPAMTRGRSFFSTAAPADGRIWVFGGLINSSVAIADSEVYDPGTGRWTATTPTPTALGGGASWLASDGRFYVVGGYLSAFYLDTTLIFDLTAQRWSTGPMQPMTRGFGRLVEAPTGVLLHLDGRDQSNWGTTNVWGLPLGGTSWR